MAKTLALFKKEFEDLKKLASTSVEEIGSLDHNMNHYQQMLNEGFKEVGLRIHALRDAGTPGTKIEDFMGDREMAVMIKELSGYRDSGKQAALKAKAIRDTQFKAIRTRMQALQDGLTTEIADRKKKFASKTLGINQSVKEMDPLLAEVTTYAGRNPDYELIRHDPGSYTAAQFDRQYAGLLAEELSKSKAVALSDQQQMLLKQSLAVRTLELNLSKARAAYAEVAKQAKLAQTAQKARDIQGLARAKQAAAAGLAKTEAVIAPYEKVAKDAKLMDVLKHSPDGGAVLKNLAALHTVGVQAHSEAEEAEGRRLA
jgi:hypothetical protein